MKARTLSLSAAAVAALLVVFAAASLAEGDSLKSDLGEAFAPKDITKMPEGTLIQEDYNDYIRHGPFELIPFNEIPNACGIPAKNGLVQADVRVEEFDALEEARGHDLFANPGYIPDGWALTDGQAQTVIWSDGSTTDSLLSLYYEHPEAFPISITRMLAADDCVIQLPGVEDGFGQSYTLGHVHGHEAVYWTQSPGQGAQVPLWVQWVDSDGVRTTVESTAIDLDVLTRIAEALGND